MPRPNPTLILLLSFPIATTVTGCAESNWIIPCPTGAQQSDLWSHDPRTRGWSGVDVRYIVYGDYIDAEIRSTDHRHGFNARGQGWFENQQGQRFSSFQDDQHSPIWVMRFGDCEERYLSKDITTNRGRALKLYKPATTSPLP